MPRRRQDFPDGDGNLRFFPGGTSFDPLTLITGNGGFFRADMGVTGSPNVTAWADQSSFTNNLSSSTNPQFSATSFNSSHPGITFNDGGLKLLASAGLNMSTTTLSMFMLLQTLNNPNSNSRLAVFINGAAEIDPASAILAYGNAPGGGFYGYNYPNVQGNGGASTVSNAGIYLFGVTFNGTNANIWLNGTVQGAATSDTATLGSGTVAHLWVGDSASATAAFTVAAAGFTEKAMNSTDWGNLKTWCNTNWGTSF